MKTILTILAVLAVLALAVFAFTGSGLYDVAATAPDNGLVEGLLRRTMHRSVERRSEGIQVPPLDDAGMIREGLIHYYEMCATCHGAPGIQLSPIGQGLNPAPPELASKAEPDEAAEWFWIVKNGIKMTGMPAFGPTHTDEEIWAILAFVQQMPKMTPDEYQRMVVDAGLEPGMATTAPVPVAVAPEPIPVPPGPSPTPIVPETAPVVPETAPRPAPLSTPEPTPSGAREH